MKTLQPGYHTIQVDSVVAQRNFGCSVFCVKGRVTASDHPTWSASDGEVLCYIWGSKDAPEPVPGTSVRVETFAKRLKQAGHGVNVTRLAQG